MNCPEDGHFPGLREEFHGHHGQALHFQGQQRGRHGLVLQKVTRYTFEGGWRTENRAWVIFFWGVSWWLIDVNSDYVVNVWWFVL